MSEYPKECCLCVRPVYDDEDYCSLCLHEMQKKAEQEQAQLERQYRRDVL